MLISETNKNNQITDEFVDDLTFMLQEQLCVKIISKKFWSKLGKRREKEFGKDEIDIKWLRAQVTRNAFVEIAETIGLGVERKSLCSDVISREEAARQDQIDERVKQAKMTMALHKRSSRRNLKKRRREQKVKQSRIS